MALLSFLYSSEVHRDGIFGGVVLNEELIFGRAVGVDAGHYVDCAEFGLLTLFVAFEAGLGLVDEELVPRGVMDHLCAGDAILR